MSPEQCVGDKPDSRSDIYSLGIVTNYLLTAVTPFAEENAMKVLLAHARDNPLPPSELNRSIPTDLERVVMRCLNKDPNDRYQDVDQLRHALLDCELAKSWTRDMAEDWWKHNGCPQKKALDSSVLID